MFEVQASKSEVVAPDLDPDDQVDCCSSCSYSSWHWVGLIGTIVIILGAVITVIFYLYGNIVITIAW